MRGSFYRALIVVGDRWTITLLLQLSMGVGRFDTLCAELGIARNILSHRLTLLTNEGLIQRSLYNKYPPRHEYKITEKGLAIAPFLDELAQWGEYYYPDDAGV